MFDGVRRAAGQLEMMVIVDVPHRLYYIQAAEKWLTETDEVETGESVMRVC